MATAFLILVLVVLTALFVLGIAVGWRLRDDGISAEIDRQTEDRARGLWTSLEVQRSAWEAERQMWAEALRQRGGSGWQPGA